MKYYMNNPCEIIRPINDDFSEVSIAHQFNQSMELSGQCMGCCVGDSDNKLSCTCDDHSWIIEEFQNDTNRILCIVENRLLRDSPIEMTAINKLKDEISKEKAKFDQTKELHKEWLDATKAEKENNAALKLENTALKQSISASINIRDLALVGIDRLTKKHELILVDIAKYSSKAKQISLGDYQKLIGRAEMMDALEAGGVDNWEWYSESLKSIRKI